MQANHIQCSAEACRSQSGKKHRLWTPCLESCSLPGATPKYRWLVPGGTALHVAAWNSNADSLDILLAYGANSNAKALDGRTPLHYAVDAGCATITAKLLQHGVAPRCPDLEHITPFTLACIAGKTEMLKILIQFEDDKTAVDICGSTALHHAARNHQLETFVYLLDAGWNPYQLDRSFCSPICYAIEHPRLATYVHAKYLDISHLAMTQEKRREISLHGSSTATRCFYRRFPEPARLRYLNTQAMGQLTPLMMEANHGRVERMRILVLAGADLEVCDSVLGTALTISCHSNQFSSVKFLVRQGAKLIWNIKGRVVTALQAASSYRDIVHWFLVDRYLDQGKLTDSPFDSEREPEVRFWSGVRQVQILLRGKFERPMNVSLEKHARYLHNITIPRDGWRCLVPLGWDAVAHFTPLPAELGHCKGV
jgi:ankyrin repeat protein